MQFPASIGAKQPDQLLGNKELTHSKRQYTGKPKALKFLQESQSQLVSPWTGRYHTVQALTTKGPDRIERLVTFDFQWNSKIKLLQSSIFHVYQREDK